MATVNIQIKTNKDHTSFKQAGQKQANAVRIQELIKGMVSGAVVGSMEVQTSSADPVAASGTLTLTYSGISADDTVVIAGQTLTCKSSGTAANTFVKTGDATATATNLKNAINANATLAKYVVATSAAAVVTVTANQKCSMGNLVTLVGSAGIVASAATLAGGTGGAEGSSEVVR